MKSIDIIAKAVKDYTNLQIKNGRCIDCEYIVHFFQKYEWEDKWEECTVIGYCDGFPIGVIEFSNDFYEGQTEVKDIVVMSLHEVGDVLHKTFLLVKEMKQDEKK